MGSVTLCQVWLCLQVALLYASDIPPRLFEGGRSRVIAKLGKATRLECPVALDDTSRVFPIDWKKDGQALNPGSYRYNYQGPEHTVLRIKPVQMNDAGVYSCTAINGFGSVTRNFTVVVKDEENQVYQEGNRQYKISDNIDIERQGSKPMWENYPKMEEDQVMKKPKGSTIYLTCRVDGNPRPQVHWMRNGQPFDELHQQNGLARLRNNQAVLRLSGLSDADDGQYTCVAVNSLGSINFTYTLDVVSEINAKPRLIAPYPRNHTVSVGESVSFHCYVQSDESDQKPEVEWLKQVEEGQDVANPVKYNGEMYHVLQEAGRWLRERLKDGSYLNKLVIRNVQLEDQGLYVCSATNRMGFVSRKAFLTVRPATRHSSNRGQNLYNVPHSTYMDPSQNPSARDPSMSPHDNDDEDSKSNLPLQIALPACAAVVLIILVIFLMQRNNRCRKSPHLTPPTHTAPRIPVPPHEREAYYYSNVSQHHLHQQQQAVNPLLLSSREKMACPPKMMVISPTPSGDITGGSSDFSSVSRTHPSTNTTPHYYHPNHLNYGY